MFFQVRRMEMKPFTWILLSVIFARLSAASGTMTRVDKKAGDPVVLQPREAPVTDSISSILWLHNAALAVEFDGKETEYFRHFKARGELNILNGELTITGLTVNDSGLYTAEVNGLQPTAATRLRVLSPVPVPTVQATCDDQKHICTLECVGNIQADAEPVYYKWTFGDVVKPNSSKKHTLTKEDSAALREVSCVMENAASQEHSSTIPNPFASNTGDRSSGVMVFFSLLGVVLLLVLSHKCLTGKWFFQKGSVPWKAAFWKKEGKEEISVTQVS